MASLSMLDQLCIAIENGLRSVLHIPASSRPYPAEQVNSDTLSATEKKHAAGLMRVNHAGEVCAQALYQGQAITTQNTEIKTALQQCAAEENDHLNWCATRLQELDSQCSYLNPLWYCGSMAIGMAAGMAGDKWNLGFLAETEQQVCQHIDKHLQSLPTTDDSSRLILQQMRIDESNHANTAYQHGAAQLPWPAQMAMKLVSKVMVKSSYYF